MFPNRMRGAALAASGATNWVANFIVTVTFLPLLSVTGLAGAYALYALAAVVSLPFVWATVRETRGKTREQMDAGSRWVYRPESVSVGALARLPLSVSYPGSSERCDAVRRKAPWPVVIGKLMPGELIPHSVLMGQAIKAS